MVSTDDIVDLSLKLADMNELPNDSAVYVEGKNIKKILYGIDIGTTELLYAKHNGYDCVLAHHPVGVIESYKEFKRHLIQLQSKGVSIKDGENLIMDKIIGYKYANHAKNYDAIPSLARLLNIPFLNIHCPSDELGRQLISNSIEKLVEEKPAAILADLQHHLTNSFIEFKKAKTKIEIAHGSEKDLLGDWIFSHGALTNGGYAIADAYFNQKVNTVIYIHIAPGELIQIKKANKGHLVITGHIASDSIGINPLLDELEKVGCSITAIGGLIR